MFFIPKHFVPTQQRFSTWSRDPRWLVNNFWRVTSRYFINTAVLHLLYSSLDLGL